VADCCFRVNSCLFFFSSRRRHTSFSRDWSSDVCSSDLVLERIRENLVQAFAEHEWPVTLSMGICHCYDPMLHRDASLILRAADKAMYEAKAQGKNQIRIATVAVYSE